MACLLETELLPAIDIIIKNGSVANLQKTLSPHLTWAYNSEREEWTNFHRKTVSSQQDTIADSTDIIVIEIFDVTRQMCRRSLQVWRLKMAFPNTT